MFVTLCVRVPQAGQWPQVIILTVSHESVGWVGAHMTNSSFLAFLASHLGRFISSVRGTPSFTEFSLYSYHCLK